MARQRAIHAVHESVQRIGLALSLVVFITALVFMIEPILVPPYTDHVVNLVLASAF